MTDPSKAVFLSYASEDAEAAQRIADALRAAGIEVWFDRSELRGGDTWDRNIRDQIHQCRLFVPIISAHSEARDEGYFRREWKLAVDRTHDMAEKRAFLVPVVIDDTPERGASVPDKFRDVQWTRLPGGNADAAFVERVRRLVPGEAAPAPTRVATMVRPAVASKSDQPSSRRRKSVFVAVIAALAAALVVGYLVHGKRGQREPIAQAAASIAVLPLANESGDPSQQYFSDGLSENLITALTQFPGLKVIGRTSAFQFRDSKEDAHSIGAKLGVARLLEGSVQRSGDTVRVSAELIDTADSSTKWSERYDRPYKNLFALQDDITHAVVVALRARLLSDQRAQKQDERPPSGNLEAYSAVLQGRFHQFQGTEAGNLRAIEFFTQAAQRDSQYALAWSELSQTWTDRGVYFLEGTPAQEAYAKARVASDRALALSPGLAAAHLARGNLLQNADFDWRGAEAELRRAVELAPNDGNAEFWLGHQLATLGDVEQAVELTRRALATDPLKAAWHGWLAWYLPALNRLAEAERAVREAIELQPGAVASYYTLTVIEIERGNASAALSAARQEVPGSYQNSALALAREVGGDRIEADAALRTLIDKNAGSSAYQIAQVYALRNDATNTFKWLDRAWSNRDTGISMILFDPFILRFKDDPRFAAFCRKVGLPVPGEKARAI